MAAGTRWTRNSCSPPDPAGRRAALQANQFAAPGIQWSMVAVMKSPGPPTRAEFHEAISTRSDRWYAACLKITRNPDLAEDAVQEALASAWDKRHQFQHTARLDTWIHRIAVNAALQALRKAETRTRREGPAPDHVPVAPAHTDTLLRRRLERALDSLPEGMRQVLILHDVEGYTHEEIGEVLGVTSGTSKSQLFKARAKMRAMLASLSGSVQEHGAEAWSI